MDVLDYFASSVKNQAYTFDVYRNTGGNSYSEEKQKVGEVTVSISDRSSQSQTTVEGSDESVNFKGLLNPQYDENGTLTEVVFVNDELWRQNGEQRYVVKTKDGRPNDIEPDLWELGLDRANSSN